MPDNIPGKKTRIFLSTIHASHEVADPHKYNGSRYITEFMQARSGQAGWGLKFIGQFTIAHLTIVTNGITHSLAYSLSLADSLT